MSYAAGMRDTRVTFTKRETATDGDFGRKGGEYKTLRTVWADVEWSRGTKSMREGALDAYDVIMVRCNYFDDVTRECRMVVNGTTYQIQSFHADMHANKIQITAQEIQ